MLALFRGYSNLCVDLFEHPDEVRSALQELLRGFVWINGRRFEIINAEGEGAAFVGIWAPGRLASVACDFSCLISAEHYREFVMPEMVEICEWLDYSIYHLDGPEATHHLPALFDLDALDCIQFICGAKHAHEHATHWIPLYKRIQDAGKLIQIFARRDEIEPLLEHLDPRGIVFMTSAPSIEEAEDLLRKAERWSCQGVHPVQKHTRPPPPCPRSRDTVRTKG